MPRGNPTKQTIASEKYQKKAGYVSKSYKLKRDVVESFAEACDKACIAQSAKITELMQGFIDEINKA